MSNAKKILSQQQYLNPLLAGLLLGLVLLMTFAITGHGLGATGFTTRLAAWIGMHVAPVVTNANDYLGGMVEEGKPCLLYTSPSPRDRTRSRMPSSA